MKSRLTLTIVTRKRPEKLSRCLESITKQSLIPNTVLVIDNDSKASSQKVCSLFKKRLPIKYVVEKKQGIPQARNKALNLCKTTLLAFIDDDCVADKKWVEEAEKIIYQNDTTYFLGKSLLLNNKNIIAQAQYYRQSYWFYHWIDALNVTSPFNVDTKNIVLRIKDLKQHKIVFDQKLFLHTTGGHADTDLGFQLAKAGLEGKYRSKMVVNHEEVGSLKSYVNKACFRGKVGFLLYDKWQLEGEMVFLPDIKLIKWIKRIKYWPVEYRNWTKKIKGHVLKKIIIFLLIKLYDRAYLQGFVDKAREMGQAEYINRLILSDKR